MNKCERCGIELPIRKTKCVHCIWVENYEKALKNKTAHLTTQIRD
jgi:hypothetical protein